MVDSEENDKFDLGGKGLKVLSMYLCVLVHPARAYPGFQVALTL